MAERRSGAGHSRRHGRYAASRLGQAEVIDARRLERLDRGHAVVQRRAQLPQRRQGAGVERAPGHAAAAHARPHDDIDPEGSQAGPGDWLRRGRHRRSGLDRAEARAGHDRRDRAAGAGDGIAALRPPQLRRLQEPEDPPGARRRPALPDDDRESSTPSRRTRWIRGSRAQPRSTPASSSTK